MRLVQVLGKGIVAAFRAPAWVAALALLAAGGGPAVAVEIGDSVVIHGFGGWAYGSTDGNAYAVGNEEGNFDNADFSLNISSSPYEKLSFVAQVQFREQDDEAQAELEYAFAEWTFSDSLKMRVGRVPHAFGIYAEIFDVGTLRPFFVLPQSIYGPQGVIAEFYNGVGLTGIHQGASSWGVEYDVYLGQLSGEFRIPGLISTRPDAQLLGVVDADFDTQDIVGGKLDILTPLDGLRFGVSYYTGDQTLDQVIGGENSVSVDTLGFHIEYLSERWALRGEFVSQERPGLFETDGGYAEAGYKLNETWQVAVRVEDWDLDLTGPLPPQLPAFATQLQGHEETAFGLGYWFNPNFVLKASYSQVEGNRFAFPDDPAEIGLALSTDNLENDTDLFTFGAHFSF